MGLYLSLNLTPTVSQEQWERFWCDSLRMLQEMPLRLVRAALHESPHGAVHVWTRNLTGTDEHGEFWEIAGDADSLLYAEPVRLYRNLEVYRKQWKKCKSKKLADKEDPLFCTAKDYENAGDNPVPISDVDLFYSRTQGYPYHHAVSAVIILAEHRFPLHVFGWGDLRPKGCETVRQWLVSLFDGESILPPIALDAARLWNRIEGTCGDINVTIKRFEERFVGTRAQQIHRMLAESQIATMHKLAEELIRYNEITLGFEELSKAFLEATDDLELFLDLIVLRNTLAACKERTVIPLESVLKMLVGAFVTYSQWQGESLRTLRRWLDVEGGAVQTLNISLMKLSIPDFFEFYCSEKDLIEAFVHQEPAKQMIFEKVIQETLEKNAEKEEMIKDFVQKMNERAAAKEKADGYPYNESDSSFVRFMKSEVFLQSMLREDLSDENVAALARYFGSFTNHMRRDTVAKEQWANLNDPTGESQKRIFAGILKDNEGCLLEEAVYAIEQTEDIELLCFLIFIATHLFVPHFRKAGIKMFGEVFEKVRPALWHLLNKPKWWRTVQDHLLDAV